jgi:hypothetical protein
MDAWSIHRLVRPFLAVDGLTVDGEESTVVLRTRDEELRIACESPALAIDVARGLDRLRNPEDALWSEVMADTGHADWLELLDRLDERSFIDDACGLAAGPALEQRVQRFFADIGGTVESVLARLPEATRQQAREIVERLLEEVECLLGGSGGSAASQPDRPRGSSPPIDVLSESNFYLACLAWQARYVRQSLPSALLAMDLVLTRVLQSLRPPNCEPACTPLQEAAPLDPSPWLGGLYSERDVRAQLTALAELLIRSVGPDAARLCSPRTTPVAAGSGLAFILEAERATRAALKDLGDGRYVRAIRAQPRGGSPLMVGCYVEEYHVTYRFVEILTPLLRKRLALGMRQLMFQYFAEEVGHEAFERATCISLGVEETQLVASLPLPLHLAFVDVLTQLAETDPIGFMASIMVTEGMLGEPAVVNDLLASAGGEIEGFREVSRRHERLNTKLNHSSIARLLLSQVPAIAPADQWRAIASLLFVLELNHRAWDALCDFYGAGPELSLHGWLSSRLPPAS